MVETGVLLQRYPADEKEATPCRIIGLQSGIQLSGSGVTRVSAS
jgi:hypothetical protein